MANNFTTPATLPGPSTPPGTFTTAPAGAAAGVYASRHDLEDLFGRDNIARWSQLDNDSIAADPARVARSLLSADADIDNFFRGGPYALPLQPTAGRPAVTRWAATLAGAWLYAGRAMASGTPFPYAALLAGVRAEMASYKAGVQRLDAPRLANQPTGPVVAT